MEALYGVDWNESYAGVAGFVGWGLYLLWVLAFLGFGSSALVGGDGIHVKHSTFL